MTKTPTYVLLIEDNPADARLVFEYLKESDKEYCIEHVTTVKAGLEKLSDEPNVILLDLSLPDSSGLETVSRMHEAADGIPIVVMTGLGDEEVGLDAVSLGAQDYLVKGDVDTQNLARSLRFAIKRNTRVQASTPDPSANTSSLPTSFGPFQLEREVGSGGTAFIYLASEKLSTGEIRQCVVKRLKPDLAKDPEIRSLFAEEARVGTLLNHPNIVHLYGAGEILDTPYLSLEYISGLSLSHCQMRRSGKAFPLELSLRIAHQLADALDYAHRLVAPTGETLKLVHRDVTPENIILTYTGDIKLLDFGIARFTGRETTTRFSMPKGKLPYMAPEQLRFERIDCRADIYATGVVLLELLSGRILFPDGVLVVSDAENFVRMRCRQQRLPQDLQDLILKMTNLEAGKRPSSMSEVLEELAEIIAHEHRAVDKDTFDLNDFLGNENNTPVATAPGAQFRTGEAITGHYPDISATLGLQFGSTGENDTLDITPGPSPAIRPEKYLGEAFGRYDVLTALGSGGMASVSLAAETLMDGSKRYVAIKTLLESEQNSEEKRQLFLEEARLGSLINHPNIIQMHEFGIEGDQPFIVMEFINGVSLRDLFVLHRDQALPPNICIEIAIHLCKALSYAHGLSNAKMELLHLIHRDITPENILITRNGEVKVSDFGIAKFEGREIETAFGTLRGKSAYFAPEQAFFQNIDHRVDLYSLGLVLGEMLIGEMLSPGGAIDAQCIPELIKTKCQDRDDVDGELIELICQLTSYDASERPPTAALACQKLEQIKKRQIASIDLRDFIFGLLEHHVPDIYDIDVIEYVTTIRNAIESADKDAPIARVHSTNNTLLDLFSQTGAGQRQSAERPPTKLDQIQKNVINFFRKK